MFNIGIIFNAGHWQASKFISIIPNSTTYNDSFNCIAFLNGGEIVIYQKRLDGKVPTIGINCLIDYISSKISVNLESNAGNLAKVLL